MNRITADDRNEFARFAGEALLGKYPSIADVFAAQYGPQLPPPVKSKMDQIDQRYSFPRLKRVSGNPDLIKNIQEQRRKRDAKKSRGTK